MRSTPAQKSAAAFPSVFQGRHKRRDDRQRQQPGDDGTQHSFEPFAAVRRNALQHGENDAERGHRSRYKRERRGERAPESRLLIAAKVAAFIAIGPGVTCDIATSWLKPSPVIQPFLITSWYSISGSVESPPPKAVIPTCRKAHTAPKSSSSRCGPLTRVLKSKHARHSCERMNVEHSYRRDDEQVGDQVPPFAQSAP